MLRCGGGLPEVSCGVVFSGDCYRFCQMMHARSGRGSDGPGVVGRLTLSHSSSGEGLGGGEAHGEDSTVEGSPELGSQILDVRLRMLGALGSMGRLQGVLGYSLDARGGQEKSGGECWLEKCTVL